jgi:antitoxin (DNA-binding transcriptional repressor) of toxin-antitoxin stability system
MAEITATEAARNFSRLLDEVDRERRSFLISRGGKIVAAIGPPGPRSMTVREVFELLRAAPRPDQDYAADVMAARHALPPLSMEDPWTE